MALTALRELPLPTQKALTRRDQKPLLKHFHYSFEVGRGGTFQRSTEMANQQRRARRDESKKNENKTTKLQHRNCLIYW
eukprot:807582-Prymnesium_polylepis.1